MTREQALFSAAKFLLEVHPVERTNIFQPGTSSWTRHEDIIAAENELIIALAAYEGHAFTAPHPEVPALERASKDPAFNNGSR